MSLTNTIQRIHDLEGIKGLQEYIKNTPSENTQVERLNKVRSYFKQLDRIDIVDSYFPWDKDLIDSYKENRSNYLTYKLKHKIEVYFTLDEYKQIEKDLRCHYCNVYSIIIAGLNSGRRVSELATGIFEIKSNNEITLLNPLKKKGKEKSITFPLLFCDSKQFLKDINTFRESGIDASWAQLKVGEIFKAVDKGFSFHTLRSLYAYYSYEIYCDNPSYEKILWISDILGHEKSNYTSSLHYSRYWTEGKHKGKSLYPLLKIREIVEKNKSKERDFSPKEGKVITLDKQQLLSLAIHHDLRSDSRNNRESQYSKLVNAIVEALGYQDNIEFEQKGMIRLLRNLYKRAYEGSDISGRALKIFYDDVWGYSE